MSPKFVHYLSAKLHPNVQLECAAGFEVAVFNVYKMAGLGGDVELIGDYSLLLSSI